MQEQEISAKIMVEIHDINHIMRGVHMKMEQSFGDWRILSMIHHHFKMTQEGMKITTIAEILKVSLPTVSQRVADFEQQGYLERKPSTKDRRVCYLLLTTKGEEAIKESHKYLMEKCAQVIGNMGEEKSMQLFELLQEFKTCLGQVKV